MSSIVAPGDFAAIPEMDSWEAEMLKDIYNAVSELNMWENMRNFSEQSFMFSRSTWLSEVQGKMKLMDQHSGSSYGICMRIIESIAKSGWDAYFYGRLENNARRKREEAERAQMFRA
jgi:hypothetical protein